MAKRGAAAKDNVNVSGEIRSLVEANKTIRGPEVIAALKEKFPGIKLNTNSVQVAYANIRKKMGLTRTVKARPKKAAAPGRPSRIGASVVPVGTGVNIDLLQAAKALLQACNGDETAATQALKQLASLQMK